MAHSLSPLLSFMDVAQIEQASSTFYQAGPIQGQYLTGKSRIAIFPTRVGEMVGKLLMGSGLPQTILAHIWNLSHISQTGTLSLPEFCLALYLTQYALGGNTLPPQLPDNISQSVLQAIHTVKSGQTGSFQTVPQSSSKTPTLTSFPAIKKSHTWAIDQNEKAQSDAMFKMWDPTNCGFISGDRARSIFSSSGLSDAILAHIWNLADTHQHGKLNPDEFAVAMHLVYRKLNGQDLPSVLPPELIPPSTRDLDDMASIMKHQVINTLLNKNPKPTPALFSSVASANEALSSTFEKPKTSAVAVFEADRDVEEMQRKEWTEKIEEKKKQIGMVKAKLEAAEKATRDMNQTINALKKDILLADDRIQQSLQQLETRMSEITSRPNSGVDPHYVAQQADIAMAELRQLMQECLSLNEKRTDKKIQEAKQKQPSSTPSMDLGGLLNTNSSSADPVASRAAQLLAQRMAALGVGGSSAASTLPSELERIQKEKKEKDEELRCKFELVSKSYEKIMACRSNSVSSASPFVQVWKPSIEQQEKFENGVGLTSDEVKKLVVEMKNKRSPVKPLSNVSSHSTWMDASAVKSVPLNGTLSKQGSVVGPPVETRPMKPLLDSLPTGFLGDNTSTNRPPFVPAQPMPVMDTTTSSVTMTSSSPNVSDKRKAAAAVSDALAKAEAAIQAVKDRVGKEFSADMNSPMLSPSFPPIVPSTGHVPPLEPKPNVLVANPIVPPPAKIAPVAPVHPVEPVKKPIENVPKTIPQEEMKPIQSIEKASNAAVKLDPSQPLGGAKVSDLRKSIQATFEKPDVKKATSEKPEVKTQIPPSTQSKAFMQAKKAVEFGLNGAPTSTSSDVKSVNGPASDNFNQAKALLQKNLFSQPQESRPIEVSLSNDDSTLVSLATSSIGIPPPPPPPPPETPRASASTRENAINTSEDGNDKLVVVSKAPLNIPLVPSISSNNEHAANVFEQSSPSQTMLIKVKALYDFVATRDDELGFKLGDELEVVSENGDWYTGRKVGTQQTGWFPRNYVEEADKVVVPSSPLLVIPEVKIGEAVVLYDYEAQRQDELTIKVDQQVDILFKVDMNWWKVRNEEQQSGLVPATYIREVVEEFVDPLFPKRLAPTANALKGATERRSSGVARLLGDETGDSGLNASARKSSVGSLQQHTGIPRSWSTSLRPSVTSAPTWAGHIDESVLQTLSNEERKRQESIFELIGTEKTYVRDLQIIVEQFYQPMTAFTTKKDLDALFSNIEEILMANTLILSDFEAVQTADNFMISTIGDTFLKHASRCHETYSKYCANLSGGIKLLQKKRQEDKKLNDFLKNVQKSPQCRNLDLSSFMLLPMQRITRYTLLFKQILHYTPKGHADHDLLVQTLDLSEATADLINTAAREQENRDKVDELMSQIDWSGGPTLDLKAPTKLVGPRQFIHQGDLTKSKSGKKLRAYLFNDLILFALKQKGSQGMTLYRQPYLLQDASVEDDEGSGDGFTFSLVYGSETMSLKASSVVEKRQWIEKIQTQCQYLSTVQKRVKSGSSGALLGSTGRLDAIGTLQLTILEGKNLAPYAKAGKNEVFCRAKLNRQSLKTGFSKDGLNPKWNQASRFYTCNFIQTLIFSVLSLDESLRLSVYNSDPYSQDVYLGCADVTLDFLEYYNGRETELMTLKLKDVPCGEIFIKLSFRTA